jgi:hypothetical protein
MIHVTVETRSQNRKPEPESTRPTYLPTIITLNTYKKHEAIIGTLTLHVPVLLPRGHQA